MRYQDLGADYYHKRAQANRKARYHLAELDALGYDVILNPTAHTDGEGTGQAPAA
jgi:hypothetical protein